MIAGCVAGCQGMKERRDKDEPRASDCIILHYSAICKKLLRFFGRAFATELGDLYELYVHNGGAQRGIREGRNRIRLIIGASGNHRVRRAYY